MKRLSSDSFDSMYISESYLLCENNLYVLKCSSGEREIEIDCKCLIETSL